jgi:Rrf2 family protein
MDLRDPSWTKAAQGPIRLTRGAGYAIRAMAALARPGGGAVCTIRDLARREGLPRTFLAKVVRALVRADLLDARSGARGGVRLARPPERIALLEIVEATDGRFERRACVLAAGPAPGRLARSTARSAARRTLCGKRSAASRWTG